MAVTFALGGAHPEHRVKIEGIIRGLCARFPRVPLKEVRLYDPGPDDRSMGNADREGVIEFNKFWFKQHPDVLNAAAHENYMVPIDGHMIGWHGDPPMGEPEHVCVHEFAHVAVKAIPQWRAWAQRNWDAVTRDPQLAPTGYALAGVDEFFAEAFALYIINGEAPEKFRPLLDQTDDDDDAPATKDIVALVGCDPADLVAENGRSPLRTWPTRPARR